MLLKLLGLRDLLQSHHTKPLYKLDATFLRSRRTAVEVQGMTWKSQKEWNPRAQEWRQSWPRDTKGEKEKAKKQKDQGSGKGHFFVAHDGRKVQVPQGPGTSSAASSSSSTQAMIEENKKLRDALRNLVDKGPKDGDSTVVEECKKLVHDPREELRVRQRELNKEKKAITKQQKIEQTIKEKQESFQAWRAGFMEGLKGEDARHQEEIEALRKELKENTEDEEKMDEEDETDKDKGLVFQELAEVKHRMSYMASYVEAMERKNQQLVSEMSSQVQSLVSAMRTTHQQELFNQESPQIVKTPSRVALAAGGGETAGRSDRSRSPCKKTDKEVEEENASREKEELFHRILRDVPMEIYVEVRAIVEAEIASYQTKEQVDDLVRYMIAQAKALPPAVTLDSLDSPSETPGMIRPVLQPFGGPSHPYKKLEKNKEVKPSEAAK